MTGFAVSMNRIALLMMLAFPLWTGGCGNKEKAQSAAVQTKAAKPAPAPPAAQEEKPAPQEVAYRYNPEGRRDPFRSLLAQEKDKKDTARRDDLPPLQRFGVEEFVLGGITWDDKGAMALARGPDGKGYILKPGMLLGPNGGVVKRITPSDVEVHEKATDYRGKITTRVILLELHRVEEDKR